PARHCAASCSRTPRAGTAGRPPAPWPCSTEPTRHRRCSPAPSRGPRGTDRPVFRILQLLTDEEVAECRQIAEATQFADGRITNPHNLAKQNEQLHDVQAYQRSA